MLRIRRYFSSTSPSSLVPLPPPLPQITPTVDTLTAIRQLSASNQMNPTHAQALLSTMHWLTHHRLTQLRQASLATSSMRHDFSLLEQATTDPLDHLTSSPTNASQRKMDLKAQQDRLTSDLTNTLEMIREQVDTLKGELSLRITGLREEREEEGRRGEGVHQRLEGRVNVELGRWRQEEGAVKLRSVYTFTMVLAGLFSLVILSRLTKRNRDSKGQEGAKEE